jgi:hypothetical protein
MAEELLAFRIASVANRDGVRCTVRAAIFDVIERSDHYLTNVIGTQRDAIMKIANLVADRVADHLMVAPAPAPPPTPPSLTAIEVSQLRHHCREYETVASNSVNIIRRLIGDLK